MKEKVVTELVPDDDDGTIAWQVAAPASRKPEKDVVRGSILETKTAH